jgi:hypothetical protein
MPGDDELALMVYQALRAHGSFPSEAELGRAAGVGAEEARRGRLRLEDLGLLQQGDGLLEPVDPETALLRTMTAYQTSAAQQASTAAALQQLTESLMSVYRPAVAAEAAQVEVAYLTDRRHKDRTMTELAGTSRHRVDSMHPGPMPSPVVLEDSLRRDAQMREKRVRLRSIYPLSLLQSPRHVGYLQRLSDLGAEVRLLDHAPCDLVIHDGAAACVPSDPGSPGGPMLLVRGLGPDPRAGRLLRGPVAARGPVRAGARAGRRLGGRAADRPGADGGPAAGRRAQRRPDRPQDGRAPAYGAARGGQADGAPARLQPLRGGPEARAGPGVRGGVARPGIARRGDERQTVTHEQ